MNIPDEDVLTCTKCQGPVVRAVTPRKSKGVPVTVLVEVQEDAHNEHPPSSTWALTKLGGKYHAGQITNKNQRAGMLANGIRFHVEHDEQCARTAAKNRYR